MLGKGRAWRVCNQALATDYDYRDVWRMMAFGWEQRDGEVAGDNTRGVR